MIAVVLIFIAPMIGYFREGITMTGPVRETTYVIPYHSHDKVFNYYLNVLLPHIGVIVLFLLTYLAINRLIIPTVKKMCVEVAAICVSVSV